MNHGKEGRQLIEPIVIVALAGLVVILLGGWVLADRRAARAEAECRSWESRWEDQRGHKAELQARIAGLTETIQGKDATILELKREGFSPPATQPPILPEGQEREKLPPEIMAAIEAVSDPNEPLRTELVSDAWREMQDERETEKIAAEILQGSDLNPYL